MFLIDFLSELAHDPVRQLAFRRDPAGEALRAGVDPAAIPVLRDSARLRALLASTAMPESALIYSPESALIYSPESESPESSLIYSPESALIYCTT